VLISNYHRQQTQTRQKMEDTQA